MRIILTLAFSFVFFVSVTAQYANGRLITVADLFRLADSNSVLLKYSRESIGIQSQETRIQRLARLPELTANVDAGYVSNVRVMTPKFDYVVTNPIPHFRNNYSVEASELLFKSNSVQNSIKKAVLKEQLAILDFDRDRQDVWLSLLNKYFDLSQLRNDSLIYQSNILLARRRLQDIRKLREQGMVTQNDIIRSELQIKNFELDLDEYDNDIQIVNRELCVLLGLSLDLRVIPDTAISVMNIATKPYEEYLHSAFTLLPVMRAKAVTQAIAGKDLQIARSSKWPSLLLYGGDYLQRPWIYSVPAQDIYQQFFAIGIKLQYDISSIYQSKENINLAKLNLEHQKTQNDWLSQQTELEVHAAFVKYTEATERYATLQKSRELAEDNYRIVEKKYLNQMAVMTDLLDATTAKLSAELNLGNEQINIIRRWYILQKSSGNL